MNKVILFFMLSSLTGLSVAQVNNSSAKVERHVISGEEIKIPRNVDVWLPADYDTTRKYAVLYMHDGQMLFDSTTTWNKQEWGADEITARLIAENKIKPSIIVGIWNRDDYRYTEYFPEKALDGLSKHRRKRLIRNEMKGNPLGDEYLRFIVKEVKPYIDSHYSTFTDRQNTVVMGSSMGGLISLYAICEYPDVFGGAGCLSTHLPMAGVNIFRKYDNRAAKAFRKYLAVNLPNPSTHKIYFDFGTETLDKWYKPYQKKVDKLMQRAGYNEDNWVTLKFEGYDHSERSWNARLHIPMIFLLKY
jgi:predicted alpha/beta superfamily hydrolase